MDRWTQYEDPWVLVYVMLHPIDTDRPAWLSMVAGRALWAYYDTAGNGWLEMVTGQNSYEAVPLDLDAPDWQSVAIITARLLGIDFGEHE